ncbi:RNA-binding protein [Neosynechococcus sphagnicola sy1]|uniref:RNA-binding protein n=1 Tax=Neosynechococcus sphagnicola sy1 TaxID=1497020 RepID=A0A098TIM7_9CYAN|nr:RNA-binding protein [Neosynechococcus sphagnicola]KGF71837.1 RNA-binding protein [Neosynechococcus sphagnicola sy1]
MSIRLYVGNLPEELDRQELASVFAEAGDSVSTKVITDRKTGKCRGFGFVTVKTPEQADELIEKFNGYLFKENALKIEKALPRAKGKSDEELQGSPEVEDSVAPPLERSNRRKNTQKSNKQRTTTRTSGDPEATQPDPRWAQELEKLKQLLAAQATNP